MKNYLITASLGFTLALGACSSDTNNTTQAQIDSAANARTTAMQNEMRLKNDSIINAMALIKADSALMLDSMSKIPPPAADNTKPKRMDSVRGPH